MCNRPDFEEPGQPPLAVLRAAAEAAGLTFHHVPVSGGMFPSEALAEFRRIRQEATGPVLAYCRSGTRSITMDALANPMACRSKSGSRARRRQVMIFPALPGIWLREALAVTLC